MTAPLTEDECRHGRVRRVTDVFVGVGERVSWECSNCEAKFVPLSALHASRDEAARLRNALESIEPARMGLEINATDEEARDYWFGVALEHRAIARFALTTKTGETE